MLTLSVLAGATWAAAVGLAASVGLGGGALVATGWAAGTAGLGASVGLAAGCAAWPHAASRPVPSVARATKPPVRRNARREVVRLIPVDSIVSSMLDPP